MPSHCSAYGCNNRGKHLFPIKKNLRKKWINAVNRKSWLPTKWSSLCSTHFLEDDFKKMTNTGLPLAKAVLKEGAVPSIFKGKKIVPSRKEHTLTSSVESADIPDNSSTNNEHVDSTIVGSEIEVRCVNPQEEEENMECLKIETPVKHLNAAKQTNKRRGLSVENYTDKPKAIHYYTGLDNYQKFQFVLATLGLAAYHLNYRWSKCEFLSIEDQFFMTLMKLRTAKPNIELSLEFDVAEFTVQNVLVTWINFMDRQWQELDLWPERQLVDYYMPTDFRKRYPTTRLLVDCTEVPIMQTNMPKAQQAMFSNYKNKTTLKVLVGCTPGGLGCYLSDAYGGATSDRQIVERGSLTTLCDAGDSIMADKGFNVQDIFAPKNVAINIPTLLKKTNQYDGKTVTRDRKISSKRVHIEHEIALMKTYKILRKRMNSTERILGSRIIC